VLTRKLFLRIVLAGVAISAALGVFAIFVQSSLSGQLVGSAITIVVACAFIVPVTPREAGERIDPIAILYTAYFAVAAALILALIWDFALLTSLDEAILLWVFLGIPAMLLVVAALRSRLAANPPLPASEGIAAWGAAGALGLSMFLNNAATGTLGREGVYVFGYILLAAVLVASLAATALRTPGGKLLSAPPTPLPIERRLAWVAIALALVASLASFGAIASGQGTTGDGPEWLVAMLLATIAIPIAIWNYFGLAHANIALLAIRISATVTTFIAGACATYAVRLEMGSIGAEVDFAVRATLAATIVAIASILAGLVALRIARMRAATADPVAQLEWKCPRCRTAARAAPGEHCCERCGLTTIVAFRDDRCPGCGYDLRGLPAGSCNCPECGRARQMPQRAVTTA